MNHGRTDERVLPFAAPSSAPAEPEPPKEPPGG